MARARNIKPSIMTNDELASLSAMSRLLFIYLWMLADREGRLEDKPKRIAAQALPYDANVDVDCILGDLHKCGLVRRYEANNCKYIQIVSFTKHQNPHIREADSEIPPEILGEAQPRHDQGSAKVVTSTGEGEDKAQPRSPDPLLLIPDSLIPDSIEETPRKRFDTPSGVSESVWQDFKQLRKTKKAAITDTALAGIQREASKAGYTFEQALKTCCERNWVGFNADWVTSKQTASGETPYQRTMRERFEEASGRKASNIIDITPPRMEALS